MKEAAVIIPNWNGMAYLENCLNSLEKQTYRNFEIVIVDNGSTDGSISFIRENYPSVRLHCLDRNTGFCHAVNAGIHMTDTPFVILLNNDVVCDPNFVKALVAQMRKRPGAFSCQAKMLSMAEPEKLDDAGDLYCALGWAFARGKGRDEADYRRSCRIFASCAGAAIYRRSILEKIGLFDEKHFAYLEDIDLGYRANIYGYPSYFAPGARVQHAGSASSGSAHNLFKVQNTSRNSTYLIRKNMPLWQILLNLPFLIAGFAVKTVFFARLGFGREYVKGLLNGIRIMEPEDKVLYRKGHLKNYAWIQFQLWLNLLRRIKA